MTSPTSTEVGTIIELARTLSEHPRDHESLSSAAHQIASGKGNLVFEALLDEQRHRTPDEDSAITTMMSSLEAIMDTSASVGGYLMAKLYPIACRRDWPNCDGVYGDPTLWRCHYG
jgi:hypothetical protein